MFFSMGYSQNVFATGFRPMWGGHHCCSHRPMYNYNNPMFSTGMGIALLTAMMSKNVQSSMSFSYNRSIFPMSYRPMFIPYPSYSNFSTSIRGGYERPFDLSMTYGSFNPFGSFSGKFSLSHDLRLKDEESAISRLNKLEACANSKTKAQSTATPTQTTTGVKTNSVASSGKKQSVDGYSMSDSGIELVKGFEGCRLTAYKCSANTWTIGYGHTGGVREGQTITQAEADNYLKSDIRQFEDYVKSAVKVPLTQNQFDALVSFTYNVGPGNLQKSTLLKKLNSGDYEGAANEFAKWNKAGGKELAGLTRRREAERKLFCS